MQKVPEILGVCLLVLFWPMTLTDAEVDQGAVPPDHRQENHGVPNRHAAWRAASQPQGQPPNVVFVLADDLGYNDVGWHNPWIRTPVLDSLAVGGVRLENYYVQPICTPTRSQLLTGRYQIHTGLQHQIIWWAQANALPLSTPTIAEVLGTAGYSTHMVGKWHLGFYTPDHMPTRRGFDSYFGFLTGSEDHLTHYTCYKQWCGYDLRDGQDPESGFQGAYSTHVYTDKAVEIIENHNTSNPLFLYLAYQAPHEPLQVPDSYWRRYPDIQDSNRTVFGGMVTCLDEGVGNVTSALKRAGLWNNTVFIFSADNGGQVYFSGSNSPLRGWKGSLWDGGMRAAGFVHSPLLPEGIRGTKNFQLLHVTDWFPTIQGLAGSAQLPGLDGYDQWRVLSQGEPTERREILHNIDPLFTVRGTTRYNGTFDTRVRAAIRVGDYKLITGDPSNGSWVPAPESGMPTRLSDDLPGKNVWLFNIRLDPSEMHDLSDERPDVVLTLLDRLKVYNDTAVPCRYPADDPRADPALHGDFWGPWEQDLAG